jgi:hypothetical protein
MASIRIRSEIFLTDYGINEISIPARINIGRKEVTGCTHYP